MLEPLTYEQNCPQELMSKMNTVYACISSGHKPSTCAHGASETPILISTLTRHSPTPEGFYPSSLIETDRFATCITQAFAPHPGNISSSQTPAAVQICFQNLDERTLRVVASSIVTPYPPSEIGTTLVVIKLFQHNTSCRSLYQPPQAKLGPDTDCIFTSVRDPHIPPNQFCFDPNMNQATLTTSNRHMGKNEKKPVSILVRNAQSMGVDINNDGQSSVQTPLLQLKKQPAFLYESKFIAVSELHLINRSCIVSPFLS
ncbi:MAG: hypothetical protein LVR00_07035 [Rhabdochlamydiaceae bacterium]